MESSSGHSAPLPLTRPNECTTTRLLPFLGRYGQVTLIQFKSIMDALNCVIWKCRERAILSCISMSKKQKKIKNTNKKYDSPIVFYC